ncbi:MAG: glycosyltransferase [Selenomonadaceae bacterium]|nr:glycosyltransferase [Selenomonadaceae bacterium]
MAKGKKKKSVNNTGATGGKKPLVSVILTSYNHGEYICAAIESVLNQTFTDYELLIVDDGSRDDSREKIKSYNDPRIKLFLYEENRGTVIAINEVIKSAQGKYIAVHHSDDMWTPTKLEKQIAYLEEHEECSGCFTWVNFIDENGEIYEPDKSDSYSKIFEQENKSRAQWLNYFFYQSNCLCHPSAVVRRAAYENYRLLDLHGYWQLPDYLMWIRLCFNAEIYIMPERLTLFRLRRTRQENFSAISFEKLVRQELEFSFIVKEFVNRFDDDKFFLEVFPEAERYVVDGQINRRYALARMCLARKDTAQSSFRLVGLNLLKDLLSSAEDAAQIKKLYGYDEKSYLHDGASYDVFNLSKTLATLDTELFIFTDEYKRVGDKIISIDGEKKFYCRFDFTSDEPITAIRFDPDKKNISAKINRVLINGAAQKSCRDNAAQESDGFRRFLTSDPQFIFDVDGIKGRVTVEIFGEIEENFTGKLDAKITEISTKAERLAQEVDELNQKINELNYTNLTLQNNAARLEKSNAKMERQLDEVIAANTDLQIANEQLRQEQKMKLPKSWMSNPYLYRLNRWLDYDSEDKSLAVLRLFSKMLPVNGDTKDVLKDKFYTTFAPFLKNSARYKIWRMARVEPTENIVVKMYEIQGTLNFFKEEHFEQPGKIAIQAHIFYLDLLEEMADYCANMPYKFDALISIVDDSAIKQINSVFGKIPNVDRVIVRVVPNRGRDVAPFLVGFGDIIPEYDFVLHIHSKKSLYAGSEQKKWRSALFSSLIGSEKSIRRIFKAFVDDEDVGVIYPAPSENIPYPSFTWLSNLAVGQKLLERTKIEPNRTSYFDFPAGTMFWARTRALKKFFQIGLTFEDFPKEGGQNDGTIAHAFERSILLAARTEGMKYYEFDPLTSAYSINFGSKNLWQYYGRTPKEVHECIINPPKIVSFDLFDTLLMRYVAKPEHVNEIINIKVNKFLGCEIDFPKVRREAEEEAQRINGKNVTLNDIYKSFGLLTGFDYKICDKILNLEIETEINLALPREEIVELMKYAIELSKQIWITEDTCLQTPDVDRLLRKCGITDYDKLMLSCETGLRKDNATLWEYLVGKNFTSPLKFMHIGDNESADIQMSCDRHICGYHLMSAINLFGQTPIGRILLEHIGGNMSLYSGICLGIILAKKFHNPFRLNAMYTDGTNCLILKDFRELGYWLYGVPLLTFMLWLSAQVKADEVKSLLFTARAGNLRDLYQLVTEELNIPMILVESGDEAGDCNAVVDLTEYRLGDGRRVSFTEEIDNAALLEKILTAPSGNDEAANEIRDGAIEFFEDVTEIFGDILSFVPIDKNLVNAWLIAFDGDKNIIAQNLKDTLNF